MQTIVLPISLGLSKRDVAKTLGINEGTVRARYEALVQRLWQLSQAGDGG